METGELSLALLGALEGDLADGKRRGVRGKDGVLLGLGVKEGEEVLLDLEVLENSLDDEVSVGNGSASVGRGRDVLEDLVGEALDVVGLLLLGDTGNRLLDDVDTVLKRLVGHVGKGDLEASLGRDLGDTSTHETGTEDSDALHGVGALLGVISDRRGGEGAGDGVDASGRGKLSLGAEDGAGSKHFGLGLLTEE